MFAQLSQIVHYREAARLLAQRELQVRYSNSALGVVWSLLHPLAVTAFFSLVFSVMLPSPIQRYPVFFLAGLLPWNFFSLSVTVSTSVITNNSQLVNRVRFPREILPLAVVAANAANYLVALVPLALLMLFYQVPFTLALAWLPALILVQIVLTYGVGLATAALNVYFRDVQQVIEVLMLPLFFLTLGPVLYSGQVTEDSPLRQILQVANPMAGLVALYQDVFYFGRLPDLSLLGLLAVEALVVLLIGLVIFRRLSPYFVDEL